MTILGVIGSPRTGGNTDTLVTRILAGAAQTGAHTDRVMLDDLVIRECIGCHACWRGKPCVRGDDMNALFERIAAADAFVLGTPVYWYGPTALMKAFIDRFVYFNCPQNRPQVAGKPVALAIPYEEDDPAMADPLLGFFGKSLGYLAIPLTGSVVVPGVTKMGAVTRMPAVLDEAAALGRTLVRSVSP